MKFLERMTAKGRELSLFTLWASKSYHQQELCHMVVHRGQGGWENVFPAGQMSTMGGIKVLSAKKRKWMLDRQVANILPYSVPFDSFIQYNVHLESTNHV